MNEAMRILVDVTTWVPGRTGIGLYTERLLRAWQELGTGDELLLASNTPPIDLRAMGGRKLGPRFPIRAIWLQTAVPLQIARCKPDFAFFPNYIAPIIPTVPYVITVHDLAIFLYPETFTFKNACCSGRFCHCSSVKLPPCSRHQKTPAATCCACCPRIRAKWWRCRWQRPIISVCRWIRL